jgi:AcrR family transcriptional regulator
MRYPPQHKQHSRQRLLDAASRVFRERGYMGAGIDAVAAEAGMTSGAFYGHFPSKEACLVEVVRQATSQQERNRERGLDHLTGRDWTAGLLHRYLSPEHWRAVGAGCPIPTLISELPRCSAQVRAAFDDAFLKLVDRMATKLTDADDIEPDGAERTALAAIAIAVGGLALARAVDDAELAERILDASRQAGVRDLLGHDAHVDEPAAPDTQASTRNNDTTRDDVAYDTVTVTDTDTEAGLRYTSHDASPHGRPHAED